MLISPLAMSGEIQRIEVKKVASGTFGIETRIHIAVSEEQVRSRMTDYPNLPSLNSQILESELVSREVDGSSKVRTKVRPCGFFFCKTINQVQLIQRQPSGSLVATIIPEESDFEEGWAEWRFLPDKEGVVLQFQGRFKPKFWVPPLINEWVMKRMLRNELLETIVNLEKAEAD